jgi:hypothetical protein
VQTAPLSVRGVMSEDVDSEDDESAGPSGAMGVGTSPVAAGARLEELALERARRQYDAEEPSDPKWRLHKKHIFILSSAGKPIFSRYGDESKLAPMMGVLQALVSFVRDRDDTLRYIRAGRHHVVFVLRGPLYFVAASSSGETVEHLWRQLVCLHGQILSILTAKVKQMFQRNAAFDARGLLGGTDRVIRSLLHSASAEPSMLLQAVPCLRVPAATRAELNKLIAAVRPADLLCGLLLAHNHLVTLMRTRTKASLHPDDLVLVMSTVSSSFSFREDESWLPLCLPRFNANGFLYAHVSFVAPELCLVLLTPKADGFPAMSECRQQVMSRLAQQVELRDTLLPCVAEPQYAVDTLGVPEVHHCLFRIPHSLAGLEQFTAPRTGYLAGPQSPYHDTASVRRLMRHYMIAHARVHSQTGKPLREYMQLTNHELIIVWASAEFELYAAFSPLVSKPVAYAACHKLHRRMKKELPNLFMLHAAK